MALDCPQILLASTLGPLPLWIAVKGYVMWVFGQDAMQDKANLQNGTLPLPKALEEQGRVPGSN